MQYSMTEPDVACLQVNTTLTIYRNYQKVVLQETPGSGPAGRLPRSIECVLLNDLIDIAKPGEAIEVAGQLPPPLSNHVHADVTCGLDIYTCEL